MYLYGGSARVTFNHNLPPSTSIDMQLYRNHPDYPMALFRRETYTPGELSYLLSVEGTAINQHLADIEHIGQTVFQPGFAGAFQARLKYGYLGVGFTTLYRDVPFLLRNVPSFIPFYAIPRHGHPRVVLRGERRLPVHRHAVLADRIHRRQQRVEELRGALHRWPIGAHRSLDGHDTRTRQPNDL